MNEEIGKLTDVLSSDKTQSFRKALQKFEERLGREKGGVHIHSYPGMMALFDRIAFVLNEDGDLRVKEACLSVLARLCTWDDNVEIVFTGLQKLDTGFDTFLTSMTGVDPTVSENLHRHLMTILYQALGTGFQGSDLMELAESVPNAVDVLVAVFGAKDLPPKVHVAAAETLVDLSRPDAYFSAEQCTDSTGIKDLTKQFTQNLNALIHASINKKLLVTVCDLLRPWVAHTSTLRDRFASDSAFLVPLRATMESVLRFINNVLLYATEFGGQLRRHLAVDMRFVPDVVIPYVQLCLDVVSAQAKAVEGERKEEDAIVRSADVQSLCDALAVLVVATFRIKIFRQFLSFDGTVAGVLDSALLRRDPLVLSLFIKLHVNIDFLAPRKVKGAPGKAPDARTKRVQGAGGDMSAQDTAALEAAEDLLQQIKSAVDELGDKGRADLQRRLGVTDAVSPVNTSNVTHSRLLFAFDDLHYKIEKGSDAPEVAGVPSLGLPTVKPPPASTAADEGESDDEEDLVVQHTPRLGKSALSMLEDWQEMREAISTKKQAEREDGGATTTTEDSAPAPAAAPAPAPAAPAPAPVDDEPPTPEPAAAAASDAGGASAGAGAGAAPGLSAAADLPALAPPSTLGSSALPSLSTRVRAPHHVAPLAGRSIRSAPVRPPDELLCGLTKQLMQDPVQTPAGGVYDRSALEDYVADHGVDPDTKDPLEMSAVKAAADVSSKIREWQFSQLLGRRPLR